MVCDRRQFLVRSSTLVGSMTVAPRLWADDAPFGEARCQFGLVTYLWGKDLKLPQLLAACEQSGVLGVELRTTHQHGVEPSLSRQQREDVRGRFADSPVTLVGLGSNERFDSPDSGQLQAAIESAKAFIRLSHDIGSGGVKVKGDQFHPEVPHEQTVDQVVSALRQLGEFADQLDQQVRLEVHGEFQDLPLHHEIISRVDHRRVKTCWNSNAQDLAGAGLRANFELVKDHFGQTAHVRQLDAPDYPWGELIKLFVESKYSGWILLEAHGDVPPNEVVRRLRQQRELFDAYLVQAVQAVAG